MIMIYTLFIQVCAVTDDVDKKLSERRSIHARQPNEFDFDCVDNNTPTPLRLR